MEYNCLSFSHSKLTGFCRLHNFKYPPCYPAPPTVKIVSDLPFYREDDGDSAICPCNLDLTDGSWIVMQQRFDGSEDFRRDWVSYREGFGNPPDGEFWIGLEQMHQLTTSTKHILVVELVDKEGIRGCACFEEFSVGPETDGYRLNAWKYQGTAGNSLGYHSASKFSTLDRDNDNREANMISCADEYLGGGNWYNACLIQNLNGAYLQQANTPGAMVWKTFRNFTGLLKSKMLLKKKSDVYGIN
ncbi:fibrinogen-like protein 1 [Argopecten irradians]|uniref:fibrinogen-like protein 1 n=1 Tax=Argopecten irradians TaxID=31199 RepID=UPI003710C173